MTDKTATATPETPAAALTKPDKVERTPPVITTPEQYVDSLKRWRERNFHVLTPVANFSGLAPQHGVIAAVVQLNPDPEAGDVYQDKLFCGDHEVAIAKIGLSKIAQAAGISIHTDRTDQRTIANYWEVRATARWRGLDGAMQEAQATVEYDLRDGSPRVRNFKPAQIQMARQFGLRGAEARAINAAIRQFGIRQKYTKEELTKPFVTVRVMFQPDMSDPDTRRIVTEHALQGTAQLYPQRSIGPASEHLDTIGELGSDHQPIPVGQSSTAQRPATSTPPQTLPPADEPPSPDAVRIVKVDVKSGVNAQTKRAWTRWVITDSRGQEHSTFDKAIADAAARFITNNAWVDITEEADGQYKNLVEIGPAQPSLLPDHGAL
jgi:hypothetical protein